jgi:hypothetical protein
MNKIIWIALILLLGVFAIGGMSGTSGNDGAKNVTIDGYTFEGDFDNKWISGYGDTKTYKPANLEDQFGIPIGAYDWTGTENYNAFYYDSGEPSGSITKYGWAHIFVLKPDEDMANVLKSATRLLIDPKHHRNAVVAGDLTEKYIEYNGRQAYLVEIKEELMDGFVDYHDYAAIAFFLDDGKVCVIDAFTTDNFGMSAWDIIDRIEL